MTVLMYHDIVPKGDEDASGFPGIDAALYKLTPEQFDAHLQALDAASSEAANPTLTFDDGGVSAVRVADALERRGRRGWFFVTVNYIGTRGFVDRSTIRDLHGRGHLIGSHSCSHPLRMAHCPRSQLLDEWRRSRSVLSDIVGADIAAASVPGGDFGPNVAAGAAEAGFTVLFTSEPTRRVVHLGRLSIRGRYTIQRWTSAATAAALAAGATVPCAAQSLIWNAKKLSKRAAGHWYLKLRQRLLGHGDDVEWGDIGANG